MASILDAIWETRLKKKAIEKSSQSEMGGGEGFSLYYLMTTTKVHETLQLEGREVHYLGSNAYFKELLKIVWDP